VTINVVESCVSRENARGRLKSAKSFKGPPRGALSGLRLRVLLLSEDDNWSNGEEDDWTDDEWGEDEGWGEDEEW